MCEWRRRVKAAITAESRLAGRACSFFVLILIFSPPVPFTLFFFGWSLLWRPARSPPTFFFLNLSPEMCRATRYPKEKIYLETQLSLPPPRDSGCGEHSVLFLGKSKLTSRTKRNTPFPPRHTGRQAVVPQREFLRVVLWSDFRWH